MLLLAAVTHAATLAPAAAQSVGVGVEVAALVATDREWLAVPGCKDANCAAVRNEVMQGGEIDLRLGSHFGIYAQGGRVVERTDAATYQGIGFGVAGGLKGGGDIAGRFGVDGWVGLAVRDTKDPTPTEGAVADSSRHLQANVGADVRWGTAADGFMAWIGVDAVPLNDEKTLVLDGTLPVELRPMIPASAVAGIQVLSEPLSGPWAQRGRLGAGITATAGFRTGITGWLLVAM